MLSWFSGADEPQIIPCVAEIEGEEYEHVNDGCADVGRSCRVGTAEPFGGGPNDDPHRDARPHRELREDAEDKRERNCRFNECDEQRKKAGVDADDVDPEIDPLPDEIGLIADAPRKIAREVNKERVTCKSPVNPVSRMKNGVCTA